LAVDVLDALDQLDVVRRALRLLELECTLLLFGSLGAGAGVGALGDAGRLAAQAAQIIELGPADLAAADDFDRVDQRRIDREDALDALAIGDLADREAFLKAAAVAADADAFIGLDAFAGAFDHLDIDTNRVARAEIGNAALSRQLGDII